MIQQLHLSIYPKELKGGARQILAQPMPTAALLTMAKEQKQSKYSLSEEWKIEYGIHIQWNITQPEKAGHSGICYNQDERKKHYTNNQSHKRTILKGLLTPVRY